MKGFKTDKDGRWSPVHHLYVEEKESSAFSLLGGVAAALLLVAFIAWGLA